MKPSQFVHETVRKGLAAGPDPTAPQGIDRVGPQPTVFRNQPYKMVIECLQVRLVFDALVFGKRANGAEHAGIFPARVKLLPQIDLLIQPAEIHLAAVNAYRPRYGSRIGEYAPGRHA